MSKLQRFWSFGQDLRMKTKIYISYYITVSHPLSQMFIQDLFPPSHPAHPPWSHHSGSVILLSVSALGSQPHLDEPSRLLHWFSHIRTTLFSNNTFTQPLYILPISATLRVTAKRTCPWALPPGRRLVRQVSKQL